MDSGAHITAVPNKDIADMGYPLSKSKVHGLRGISGDPIQHYGSVQLMARKGEDVMQMTTASATRR